RTPILPEWCDVQQAFVAWAGAGPFPGLVAVPSQPMPPDHYTKTIVGALILLFAKTGGEIDFDETFLNEAPYRILDEIQKRDMPAEVRRRALELGTVWPKATTVNEG